MLPQTAILPNILCLTVRWCIIAIAPSLFKSAIVVLCADFVMSKSQSWSESEGSSPFSGWTTWLSLLIKCILGSSSLDHFNFMYLLFLPGVRPDNTTIFYFLVWHMCCRQIISDLFFILFSVLTASCEVTLMMAFIMGTCLS